MADQAGSLHKETAATAPAKHKWPLWHAALRCLGIALSLFPRRQRFAVAVRLAPHLVGVLGLSASFRHRQTSIVETPQEIALYYILSELARAGVEFEPRMKVQGAELVGAARAAGNGLLLLGIRTMLGEAFSQHLCNQGLPVSHVYAFPGRPFGGGRAPASIKPGRGYFLAVREALRRNEIVAATPDRGGAERRSLAVATTEGTLHVAPALLEIGCHANTTIVFMRAWLDGDAIHVEMMPARSASEPRGADELLDRYVGFIRRHLAARESGAAV